MGGLEMGGSCETLRCGSQRGHDARGSGLGRIPEARVVRRFSWCTGWVVERSGLGDAGCAVDSGAGTWDQALFVLFMFIESDRGVLLVLVCYVLVCGSCIRTLHIAHIDLMVTVTITFHTVTDNTDHTSHGRRSARPNLPFPYNGAIPIPSHYSYTLSYTHALLKRFFY